jgi:hypothetical protein
MGDYISGPNHTLPTGGMARVRGGLSVNDFVKLITVQEYVEQGMRTLGPKAALLAEAEGLVGHAEAIRARLNSLSKKNGTSFDFGFALPQGLKPDMKRERLEVRAKARTLQAGSLQNRAVGRTPKEAAKPRRGRG